MDNCGLPQDVRKWGRDLWICSMRGLYYGGDGCDSNEIWTGTDNFIYVVPIWYRENYRGKMKALTEKQCDNVIITKTAKRTAQSTATTITTTINDINED